MKKRQVPRKLLSLVVTLLTLAALPTASVFAARTGNSGAEKTPPPAVIPAQTAVAPASLNYGGAI